MPFEPIVNSFIDLNANILKRIRLSRIKLLGFEITVDEKPGSIDERLSKIEIAKQNLTEGLSAIEELKQEAEKNKREVENALLKLSELNASKDNLQGELQELKHVIASDVSAFQKLAGVPSESRIRKERIIGFISGVMASVVASGIVWILIQLFKILFPEK